MERITSGVDRDARGGKRAGRRGGGGSQACMDRPCADSALVMGQGVDGRWVEPPIGAHRPLDRAGVEPLFECEVACLVQGLGEGIARCEANEVPHEAEGGLNEGLEVSGVPSAETSLGQEEVTELGEVGVPWAASTHETLKHVPEGAEITVGGENGI